MLLDKIKDIIAMKVAEGIAPTHALVFKNLIRHSSDRKEIEAELRLLETEGKIRIGNTINDRYIVVIYPHY